MYFEIEHITRYLYTVPVSLSEHLLRFVPLQSPFQRVLSSRLQIDPAPIRQENMLDSWGNNIQRVAFAGETDHLEIHAHLEVETWQPQDFTQSLNFGLPPDYAGEFDSLIPYLNPLEEPNRLRDFLDPLVSSSNYRTADFLNALNLAVNRFYHKGVRLEGFPRTPAVTLELGEGVCRDLAILFMAACRQMGIASRFVSGYQQGEGTRLVRYLHAWPEVYLPGMGWRGYDPTHAEQVGQDHVAVATAPEAAALTPVEGGFTFIGPEVTSTLETDIRITTR